MTTQETGIHKGNVDQSWFNAIKQSVLHQSNQIITLNEHMDNLKQLCRGSRIPSSHQCRKWLWLKALHISQENIQGEVYEKTVKHIYGKNLDADIPTPKFVDKRFVNMFHLNDEGIKAVKRVIRVLAFNKPYITYSPLLQPIASICIHFHDEPSSYAILDQLTADTSNYHYLTKSVKEWCAVCELILKLTDKYSTSSIKYLRKIKIIQHDHLFIHWVEWIFLELEFEKLLSILDCFFIEGIKIIIRCAIGATYLKSCERNVTRRFNVLLYDRKWAIEQDETKNILKIGLSIRNLKRTKINRMLKAQENDFSKKYTEYFASDVNQSINNFVRNRSVGRIVTYQKELGTANVGPNLAPCNILLGGLKLETKNVKRSELVKIWQKLPARIALYTPILIFSTDIHGRRLQTLLDRVEYRNSFILIVYVSTGERIGAYASFSEVDTRNLVNMAIRQSPDATKSKFIGNGETFVFSFDDEDNFLSYHWVGDKPHMRTDMFMKFDYSGLYIGGSGNNFAIFLDSELLNGSTGHSDTFDNCPLLKHSNNSSVYFKVFAVDVIGFEYEV